MTVTIEQAALLLTALATLYLGVKDLRNKRAGGDKDISSAWLAVVQPLREQLEAATKEIAAAKARITELESQQKADKAVITTLTTTVKTQESQIKALEYQVKGLGGEPIDFHKMKE